MRYPSLPRIVIPIACTADWTTMRAIEGDGRARLCRTCDTPVYDSRSMTRGELYRLIVKHEGSLPCLRLLRRPDGTIVTGSCFAPLLRAGRLLWLRVALAAVAFWSAVVRVPIVDGAPEVEPGPGARRRAAVTRAGGGHGDDSRRPRQGDTEAADPTGYKESKGYTTGRPRHATMGKGKVTRNRKVTREDDPLKDL